MDDHLAAFTYRTNHRWGEATLFDRLDAAALDGQAMAYKESTTGAT